MRTCGKCGTVEECIIGNYYQCPRCVKTSCTESKHESTLELVSSPIMVQWFPYQELALRIPDLKIEAVFTYSAQDGYYHHNDVVLDIIVQLGSGLLLVFDTPRYRKQIASCPIGRFLYDESSGNPVCIRELLDYLPEISFEDV